jgi:hypothetical protein
MNNLRRKEISTLISKVEEIQSTLETVRDEEAEYFENIPENLNGSSRYEASQSALSSLEDAVSSLEDVHNNLEEAKE